MGKCSSFILVSLLIYFSVIQGVGGIEFIFSQDDMSIGSYYDVDDSVAIEEEASATYGSGITDSREVSGKGHIYAYQRLLSGNFWAVAGAHGPEGRYVSGGASITPTSLHAWQSASVSGLDAYAFVDGEQSYGDSLAYTWQEAGAEDGGVSTMQWVTLGSSIYSGQNTRASGLQPYATGVAAIISPPEETGGVNDQLAIIELGALEDGSIRGRLGAEVVRTPEYIDPVVYGRGIEVSGSDAAGLVAGAGSFDGILPNDFFISGSLLENNPGSLLSIFDSENLIAHGAIVGAVGAGSNSRASADYLKAGTDSHESYAYSKDILAKGDSLAAVAAAAGYMEVGPEEEIFGVTDELEVDGALAGAIGAGKNSKASARYLEAATDDWVWDLETYAFGERMKASGDSLAAVVAGAGNLRESSWMTPSEYHERFYAEGALAGAAGVGKDSKASAKYLEAGVDYWDSYAFGRKMKASGNSFAAVAAGAGNLEIRDGVDTSGGYGYLGVQGALAGAAGAGENSKASAKYLEAATDGYYTKASGKKLKAKGDEFAAVLTGSGDLRLSSDNGIQGMGAIAGGLAEGENSKVSARKVETYTDYWSTRAEVKKLDAEGNEGVLAGALVIYGPVPASPPISLAATYIALGQGALKNANFRATAAEFWAPTTLTASGNADLESAIGTASAFTLNPSDGDIGFIDPAKIHASMNAEADQGSWTSITSVSVT